MIFVSKILNNIQINMVRWNINGIFNIMSPTFFSIRNNRISNQGYSLIELLIVVVILGILAVSIGVNLSSRATKTKSFVFTIRAKFQQAKMEAVKRGRNVYIDFDFNDDDPTTAVGVGNGVVDNGFTIWVDEDKNDGNDYVDGTDSLINSFTSGNNVYTVEFENISSTGNDGIEIYTTAVSGGPGPGDGPKGAPIDPGVTAAAYRFKMNPDGTSVAGRVYLYWATTDGGGNKSVNIGPYAITVNTVGRIKISSWKKNDGKWFPDDYAADHKDFY